MYLIFYINDAVPRYLYILEYYAKLVSPEEMVHCKWNSKVLQHLLEKITFYCSVIYNIFLN